MALQTRNSRLAVVVESTEGTLVKPTAGSDFLPIQDDVSFTRGFAVLDNPELRASIGVSKPISGGEEPSASLSLMLRHSGVEGQAPSAVKELYKAIFGGEEIESTEYDTVAASTTSAINVDVGEGVQFQKGQAVLVKHSTGAYEIRPIEAIAGDVLTPGFDLVAAPGTSVALGKAVTYYPLDTGTNQALSLWYYVGNKAIQAMSGGRPTEVSMTFTAGELINTSWTVDGIKNYWNPIEITSTDIYLDFTDDGGTFAAQIAPKIYRTPHDLANAITLSMNTVQTVETHSCIYSNATGKFTISTSTSTVLSLLNSTGVNVANTMADVLGYAATDATGSTSYISDTAQSWASLAPTFDDTDALVAKSNRVMVGDAEDAVCFEAAEVTVTISLAKADINSICSGSGKSGSVYSGREVSVSVVGLLTEHDADKFQRLKDNTDTRFAYIFGEKSGGNWVAGKSGCVYSGSGTISEFNPGDADGLVTSEFTFTPFVNDTGDGEIFLSFV